MPPSSCFNTKSGYSVDVLLAALRSSTVLDHNLGCGVSKTQSMFIWGKNWELGY